MNTDNMSIAGETIDYGPCAFMDAYDPETVFSSIDQYGRYAYGNQPQIARWNLARLARRCCRCSPTTRTRRSKQANEVAGELYGAFQRAPARRAAAQARAAHRAGRRQRAGAGPPDA